MRSLHASRRTTVRTALCAAAGAAALGLSAAPAGAAAVVPADATPPVLTLPPAATFVVGAGIGDSTGPAGARPQTYPIRQRLSWSASDASGICGYRVTETYAGAEPVVLLAHTLRTWLVRSTTDYDDQQGGGSLKALSWRVTATDCAGNSTTKESVIRPVVTQENGWTYGYRGVSLAYAGRWSTSSCGCWSGDRTRYTSAAGAAVTIRRSWTAGDTVALVVARGPDRGRFTVSVDGGRSSTVETYAGEPKARQVVWATTLTAGTHALRLVNAGTAGPPRLDLDAVLFNSRQPF